MLCAAQQSRWPLQTFRDRPGSEWRSLGAGEASDAQDMFQIEFEEPTASNTAGLDMIMKVRHVHCQHYPARTLRL